MKNLECSQGNDEYTFLVKRCVSKVSILMVYVDDMIVVGDNEEKIRQMKRKILSEFDLIDLGS